MSYLCEDWTAYGCRRLVIATACVVILCLVLDCTWFHTSLHRLVAWTRHQLHRLCLRVANSLQPPPTLSLPPPPVPRIDSGVSMTESKQPHTVYVCTKCTRKCTTQSTPQDCRMGTGDSPLVDMEDLLPQPKPKTGQVLYDRLKELSVQDDIVQIVPVGCLSACDRGNVIAMGARGKYTYQFGDLDETDPEQIDHVLQFVRQWVDSSDGFSKRSTRPKRMRSNALARVPPIQECQPTCAT